MAHAANECSLPGERGRWVAIVPLRSFATGKSRLRVRLTDEVVENLVREVSTGLLQELRHSHSISQILVVSDADLSQDLDLREHRGQVETLVQSPGGGLNEAVAEAIEQVRAQDPRAGMLVIHADLPYATSAEIDQMLHIVQAQGEDAFVADQSGRGSTVIALQPGSPRRAAFGADSAARHCASGFVRIPLGQLNGLRHDLDTPEHYFSYLDRTTASAR